MSTAAPSRFRDVAGLFGQAAAIKKFGALGRVRVRQDELAELCSRAFEAGAECGEKRGAIYVHLALRNIMHLLEGGHDDAAQAEVMRLLEQGYETFARAHGWTRSKVDPRLIVHPQNSDVHESWKECWEAEDIEVRP